MLDIIEQHHTERACVILAHDSRDNVTPYRTYAQGRVTGSNHATSYHMTLWTAEKDFMDRIGELEH